MGTSGMKNPRVQVVMMDGAEFVVQSLNPDLLRFERTAAKHKWPGPGESPVTWMTFLAWSAGLREGSIPPDVTWERFSQELCAQVSNPDTDPGTEVPPTLPVPATG